MIGENSTSSNSLEIMDYFRNTVTDIKSKLDPEMVNNPVFEEILYKELSFFYGKTLKINYVIDISEDKKSVSITSYDPIVDCGNPLFRGKNKAFIRTVFSLKEDKLVCDFNQGVLFDRALIEESGVRVKTEYETKLETNYSTRYFDADGIEYSDNSFTDIYRFDDLSDDIDLRERILSSFHKPVFSEFQLPTIPIHVMKGMARNTYRKRGSFSVIHSNIGIATREGYNNVSSSLYACHPTIPERLRGGILFAKTTGDDFRFELLDNYAPDIQQAYARARKELKEGLETSNLKEYSQRTYDALINNL